MQKLGIMALFCPETPRQRANIVLGLVLVSLVVFVLYNFRMSSHQRIAIAKMKAQRENLLRGAWKRNPKDKSPRPNIFAQERIQYKRLIGLGGHKSSLTEAERESFADFQKSRQFSHLTTQAADLISQVHKVGMSRRLNYFLFGESLLGSWWHHGLLPGDATVVVFIGGRTRTEFRQGLKLLRDYTITDRGTYFEFKQKPQSQLLGLRNLKNARLRMEFYGENVTHIWEAIGHSPLYFNKSLFFPVHTRPFCGANVIVPRDTLTVLQKLFGLNDLCPQPPKGPHGKVMPSEHLLKKGSKVTCESLLGVVPFVDRSILVEKNVTFVREALKIDKVETKGIVDLPARGVCLIPVRHSLKCAINETKDHGALPM